MSDDHAEIVRIAYHSATDTRVLMWEAYYIRHTGERVTLRWFTRIEPAYAYAARCNAKPSHPPMPPHRGGAPRRGIGHRAVTEGRLAARWG